MFRSGQEKTAAMEGFYRVGLAVKELIRRNTLITSLTNGLCRYSSSWLGNAGSLFRRSVRS